MDEKSGINEKGEIVRNPGEEYEVDVDVPIFEPPAQDDTYSLLGAESETPELFGARDLAQMMLEVTTDDRKKADNNEPKLTAEQIKAVETNPEKMDEILAAKNKGMEVE